MYIVCYIIFNAANIGLALQNNYVALLILRMVQAAGSSSTVALANGVVGDIVTSAERGTYIAYASLAGMLGPIVAPILGGIIGRKSRREPQNSLSSALWEQVAVEAFPTRLPTRFGMNQLLTSLLSRICRMAFPVLVPAHLFDRRLHPADTLSAGDLQKRRGQWLDSSAFFLQEYHGSHSPQESSETGPHCEHG